VLRKKSQKLLNLQGKESTPLIRKLDAFTEKVRDDIEKRRISETDGQRLILKANMVVNMLTKT